MPDTLDRIFTDFSVKKLRQSADRIESCLSKLSPEQLWARGGEEENAIGNLVLHLCGNVRQWIVAAIGGAQDVRQRDAEFEAKGGASAEELAARLRATVEEAAAVIAALSPERLAETVDVQSYRVPVMEAVYHVVEHFSGHTGQIIFATKMLTGEDLGFYGHLRAPKSHSEKTP